MPGSLDSLYYQTPEVAGPRRLCHTGLRGAKNTLETRQRLGTKRTDANCNSGGAQCIVCAPLREEEQKWAWGWCPQHPHSPGVGRGGRETPEPADTARPRCAHASVIHELGKNSNVGKEGQMTQCADSMYIVPSAASPRAVTALPGAFDSRHCSPRLLTPRSHSQCPVCPILLGFPIPPNTPRPG